MGKEPAGVGERGTRGEQLVAMRAATTLRALGSSEYP